jgi:asparagine synthase (glutamine-hydrolysing)
MCGIAGVIRTDGDTVSLEVLGAMAAAIRHRGPDGYGFYRRGGTGLAHTRLSIIDISGGAQPLADPDGRFVIVFNGEIFNYVELRAQLKARGRTFRTRSDTEVLLQSYAEWGVDALQRLNGQFALAIHDRLDDSVFLARDRFGIRPLYWTQATGALVFGSEIKALFASGEVDRAFDPEGLDETFTFWAARPPRTAFRGVRALEPGHYAVWRDGSLSVHRYHELGYNAAELEPVDAVEQLDELLRDSVHLRLRADVTVGGYLSGGLDSSITCALAAPVSRELRTFSITFASESFDESSFQKLVAAELGTSHVVQHIDRLAIGGVFPDVVRHAETPLIRTAPAPMYLLAKLTKEHGIKVVLTGEGADELFWGYDLFKEVAVRRFCLRQPESDWRPLLFDRLYPYLAGRGRGGEFWRRFFLDAGPTSDPLFSHLPRFTIAARIKDFYSKGMQESTRGFDALGELREGLPTAFSQWSLLERAAYLEMRTLLSPYLLSSQGDRMAMAHGVEGRFPFLDPRLFDFSAHLPEKSKLRVLTEKEILRRWGRGVLPERIRARPKQPYRAPDAESFFGDGAPTFVDDLLDPAALARTGVFDSRSVEGLVRRCKAGRATGFRENQAIVAVLSTQLLQRELIDAASPTALPAGRADVVMGEPSGVPV